MLRNRLASLSLVGLIAAAQVLVAATPDAQGVRTTDLHVQVRVVDGIASTSLRQTLHNPGARNAEAIWVLPLPEGAVADDFRMTVGGVEMVGEVLAADAARNVYESIVRARKDPGLLEYFGRGCLRARVFPVPPGGEVEVEAVFRQVLPSVGGLLRWSFPAKACGVDGRAPERVTFDFGLRSTKTLGSVITPGKTIDVVRKSDHEAVASLEAKGSELTEDLAVFYGLSSDEFGLNLATTLAKGAEEGTFVMTLAPGLAKADAPQMPRSISFVLDTSGSMKGDKIGQAKAALHRFLGSLRPGDRFNVIPFATSAQPFFPREVELTEETAARALKLTEGLTAVGGTNIEDALQTALAGIRREEGRLPVVVFMTDGLPTVGEKDARKILARVDAENAAGARVFVFGVGNDVNTRLLDLMASASGGERAYVRPNESIDLKTAELFSRIGNPAMTDVSLEVEGVELMRVVPDRMPDLYRGLPITVVGRYRGTAGAASVRLSGQVGAMRREYVYEAEFAKAPVAGLEFLPSLWAERRVGVLLDAIRLNGPDPELLEEVKLLGNEHRIVTPYTSHLIVEEGLGMAPGGFSTANDGWFLGNGRRGPRSPGGGGTYRGPGDTPGSPGSAGPSTPGASGSPAGTPSSPATGGGGGGSRTANIDVDGLAKHLKTLGILPQEAPDEELRELALQVARELRDSSAGLHGLGKEASGAKAVDESTYLARLMSNGGGDETKLLDLFSRKVKGRVFLLREGVWTERGYDAAKHGDGRLHIEAWSDAYFALLRKHAGLAPYLALSDRMIVLVGEQAIEIRPAK